MSLKHSCSVSCFHMTVVTFLSRHSWEGSEQPLPTSLLRSVMGKNGHPSACRALQLKADIGSRPRWSLLQVTVLFREEALPGKVLRSPPGKAEACSPLAP